MSWIFVTLALVIIGCWLDVKRNQAAAREEAAREEAAREEAAQAAQRALKAAKEAEKIRRTQEAQRRAEARQAAQLEIAREKRRAAELRLEAERVKASAPAAASAASAQKAATAPRIPQEAPQASAPVSVPCMLARKLSDVPGALSGQPYTITEKLDGVRCVAIVRAGMVAAYTRGGSLIRDLVEIAPELAALPEGMYDGELLPDRLPGVTAAQNFKAAARIVRAEGPKTGLVYRVFDLLPLATWDARAASAPYAQRREALDALLASAHVVPVPALYRGTDPAQVSACMDRMRAEGGEGIMVNLDDEPYHFGRCAALLKVKVKQDADLRITGVNPGTGRNAGSLGSLTVDYKGGPVRVSSGIPAALRRAIWSDPSAYVGRVVTVSYLAETQDGTGKKSLRSPVFVDLRESGKLVSYN